MSRQRRPFSRRIRQKPTAVMILSTAVATPGFAKDGGHHYQDFPGAYKSMTNSSFDVGQARAERNIQNFGFSGRDRSYPGWWDANLAPSN